ncbi:MAG TPA: alpha/beta hydrolase [Cellvibrio sp.]|nr:alpha/beta hydrolase [Cellvibrio sp.]
MSNSHIHASECVILLHGLARSSDSMKEMESSLSSEGYSVVNHDYASRKNSIQVLAAEEIPAALSKCKPDEKINFITHSLGGIVLRQYLSTNSIQNLGRTVMLGPPNKGSQATDKLKNVPGYKLINGPAGMQLGTDVESVPFNLGRAEFEVGIIAGTRSINLILSTMLPNPDDGKVSVENTKLEGMADHITIPVSHPFIMKDVKAINQAIFFLKNGRFNKSTEQSS